MTLFFNLDLLEAECKKSPSSIGYYLSLLHNGQTIPKYRRGIKVNANVLKGKSFLLNPTDLLNNTWSDPSYVAQYIKLAARRDYTMYKMYGIKYLDLSFYPDVDIAKIKHNPLLQIANNKIHFIYEENYNGNRI